MFSAGRQTDCVPHDGGEAKEKVGELYSGDGYDHVSCLSKR